MPLETGTRLGSYEIVSPLGAGGMGEVYLARDSSLDRMAAIKVLPDGLASSPGGLQRFEREARTIATLNHPNIVTIYGIHQDNNSRFIAMERVEGETLDRRIVPDGMPLATILNLAIPLAEALTAAHRKNIVHRDLKPTNVMVTPEGHVKVLDFGLAKLLSADPAATSRDAVTRSTPITSHGEILGTVPYMSPEQLQSEPLDHRTDLFSLGVMLYEMATGRRPFQGHSNVAISSAILRDVPPPVHEVNHALPRQLSQIIERCLEKDVEQRCPSANDVHNELKALRALIDSDHSAAPFGTASSRPRSTLTRPPFWIGIAVLSLLAVLGINRSDDHRREARPPSVAVLPFVNMSEEENEYFSDGISAELIHGLMKIPGIRVPARTSSFAFKGRNEDIRSIGQKLRVSAVLEGSVRLAGNRVRITARLINVEDGFQRWGDQYERELEDVLSVQEEIARAIIDNLRVELGATQADEPMIRRGTTSQRAWRRYRKARHFWNRRTRPGCERALELYEKAIEEDPDYALAWAGLAETTILQASFFWADGRENIRKTRIEGIDDGVDFPTPIHIRRLEAGWWCSSEEAVVQNVENIRNTADAPVPIRVSANETVDL